MKKGQKRHKAGYRGWRGDAPAEFRAKSDQMTVEMRESIAARIAAKKGWNAKWLLSLDDKSILQIAQNNL